MAFSNSVKKALSIDNISRNIDGLIDQVNRGLNITQSIGNLVKSLKPGSSVGPSLESNISQQGAAADAIQANTSNSNSLVSLLILGAAVYFILKK